MYIRTVTITCNENLLKKKIQQKLSISMKTPHPNYYSFFLFFNTDRKFFSSLGFGLMQLLSCEKNDHKTILRYDEFMV